MAAQQDKGAQLASPSSTPTPTPTPTPASASASASASAPLVQHSDDASNNDQLQSSGSNKRARPEDEDEDEGEDGFEILEQYLPKIIHEYLDKLPLPPIKPPAIGGEAESEAHLSRPNVPSPTLSPHGQPVTDLRPGCIYKVKWQHASSPQAAIILPMNIPLHHFGLRGALENTTLLSHLPTCYVFDTRTKTFQWKARYEDGGDLVNERKYPVMYIREFHRFPGSGTYGWLFSGEIFHYDIRNLYMPERNYVKMFSRQRMRILSMMRQQYAVPRPYQPRGTADTQAPVHRRIGLQRAVIMEAIRAHRRGDASYPSNSYHFWLMMQRTANFQRALYLLAQSTARRPRILGVTGLTGTGQTNVNPDLLRRGRYQAHASARRRDPRAPLRSGAPSVPRYHPTSVSPEPYSAILNRQARQPPVNGDRPESTQRDSGVNAGQARANVSSSPSSLPLSQRLRGPGNVQVLQDEDYDGRDECHTRLSKKSQCLYDLTITPFLLRKWMRWKSESDGDGKVGRSFTAGSVRYFIAALSMH
ncbi:hypothetical protein PT974_01395 [Cladobotryum mycophilum]|uniref:Uncharacterized protein n=1 Tax=Cladobotryum mycophilum TaxID=491253 RepID=A0ABR0T3U5_9HYPO